MSNGTRASYSDTFHHAFDLKGRITVPAEWRWESFEQNLFVLPSGQNCVRVYPESWMAAMQDQVALLKDGDPVRRMAQALASRAQPTKWDQQGRIMVKEKLRLGAGLKKEAVLVGQLTHFEIWDRAAWAKQEAAAITVEEALSAMGR